MAKIKGNGRILPVYKLRYIKADGSPFDLSVPVLFQKDGKKVSAERTALAMAKKWGVVVLKYDRRGAATIFPFLQKLFERNNWREKELVGTVEVFYKRRTNEQNSLLWALLSILSMELYNDNGHTEDLYYELVDLVAPRVESRLTGITVPKRGSKLNTVEFARLIEWVFNWLMEHGVSVSSPEDVEHYWTEWANWRWSQSVDPLSATYKDTQDYRARVNYCEACRTFLPYDPDLKKYDTDRTGKEGNLAHIVPKGAGGVDGVENRLHLCTEHHVYLQHQNGWARLLKEFPHLTLRVNAARERAGVAPIDIEDAQNTHQDIKQKKYLWVHPESDSWWIEEQKEWADPLVEMVCEATVENVTEELSLAFERGNIAAKEADNVLKSIGIDPFYEKSKEVVEGEAVPIEEPELENELDIF